MHRSDKPEVLSPAGSMESVIAAVQNGCSAVYVGAMEFSARQNAKNFTLKELECAIDYCHVRGIKLYVAANTLVKDSEVERFLRLVEDIYSIGADGVIVQDIGCAALIKRHFPSLYLSGSTQMTVHDLSGVSFLTGQGFDRIVLARELSLPEISRICENAYIDIECFIHGAVCVCYSGQCLLSSYNGKRSGNRGDCAQPCRLPYKFYGGGIEVKGGILSPRDMMGLYSLPSLIECGVKSFKIEGRMKSPEYVAGVTSVYRKYVDLYFENPDEYCVDEKDIERLARIFNRNGFSNGYFGNYSGRHMMTNHEVGNSGVYIGKSISCENGHVKFKTVAELFPGDGVKVCGIEAGGYITKEFRAGEIAEVVIKNNTKEVTSLFRTFDKKLTDELRGTLRLNNRKLKIDGSFTAKLGSEIQFIVRSGDIEVFSQGDIPEKAIKTATTIVDVNKQLLKTGITPFSFDRLDISIEDGIFIGLAELNRLRRDTLSELESKIILNYKRNKNESELYTKSSVIYNKKRCGKEITVLIRNYEQLEAVAEYTFNRLYVDFDAKTSDFGRLREKGVQIYRCLDRIQRYQNGVSQELNTNWDGYLIRTYGQANVIKGYEYATDYTLNTFNKHGADFWSRENCKSVCLSPELPLSDTLKLQASLPVEVVCYGKIALMTTVQCPIGNFVGEKQKNSTHCKYRNKNAQFSIVHGKSYELLPVCDGCYCLVLGSEPIAAPKLLDGYNRIELSTENFVDVKNIMSTFQNKPTDYV